MHSTEGAFKSVQSINKGCRIVFDSTEIPVHWEALIAQQAAPLRALGTQTSRQKLQAKHCTDEAEKHAI